MGREESHSYKQSEGLGGDLWVHKVGLKESHGSHGNFYEGEQEQCRSVPVGALYGGLRISQWHKLCWSRAGVTLAGTTGQPRRSRSFPRPTSNPYLPPAPAYLH